MPPHCGGPPNASASSAGRNQGPEKRRFDACFPYTLGPVPGVEATRLDAPHNFVPLGPEPWALGPLPWAHHPKPSPPGRNRSRSTHNASNARPSGCSSASITGSAWAIGLARERRSDSRANTTSSRSRSA